MQRYGFKDGQGLGKKEQGMSVALQVEKTSKRGGRIIHEKELMGPPNLFPAALATASPPPTGGGPSGVAGTDPAAELSITEIMKSPSKVVLLRVSKYDAIGGDGNFRFYFILIFRIWSALETWTMIWSPR